MWLARRGSGRSGTTTTLNARALFVTVDGARYSIPGDRATIDADGTIRLLGRGALCINTGGEKDLPREEVEAILKSHPDVEDVLVVGASTRRALE